MTMERAERETDALRHELSRVILQHRNRHTNVGSSPSFKVVSTAVAEVLADLLLSASRGNPAITTRLIEELAHTMARRIRQQQGGGG